MRLLTVCQYNVGRSQMAKALLQSLDRRLQVRSAGLIVDRPGEVLSDYKARHEGHSFVIEAMGEIGIDVSAYRRSPLSSVFLEDIDVVIICAAEIDPASLASLRGMRIIWWRVTDPGGVSLAATRRARRQLLAAARQFLDGLFGDSGECAGDTLREDGGIAA